MDSTNALIKYDPEFGKLFQQGYACDSVLDIVDSMPECLMEESSSLPVVESFGQHPASSSSLEQVLIEENFINSLVKYDPEFGKLFQQNYANDLVMESVPDSLMEKSAQLSAAEPLGQHPVSSNSLDQVLIEKKETEKKETIFQDNIQKLPLNLTHPASSNKDGFLFRDNLSSFSWIDIPYKMGVGILAASLFIGGILSLGSYLTRSRPVPNVEVSSIQAFVPLEKLVDKESPSSAAVTHYSSHDKNYDEGFYRNVRTGDQEYVLAVFKGEQKSRLLKVTYEVVGEMPVSTGRTPGNKERAGDNRTVEGDFRVVSVEDSSKWVYEGKNAYYRRFFRLNSGSYDSQGNFNPYGLSDIGLHGTVEPQNIGKPVSHGCVRFYNDDIDFLDTMIGVGTRVKIFGANNNDYASGSFENQKSSDTIKQVSSARIGYELSNQAAASSFLQKTNQKNNQKFLYQKTIPGKSGG